MASRRRWIALGTTSVAAAVVTVGLLLGLDLYLHKRYEQSFGLNVRGYRGPVAPRKAPGETRVVVLGGSTAFGYGVKAHEALPAYLDRKLKRLAVQNELGPVSVVNLGYNREGVYSFTYTLGDYAYLEYDVVVLYQGYNDHGGPNTFMYRHSSPIFRLTGYFPLLPLAVKQMAWSIRHGDRRALYDKSAIVFEPNVAQRVTAGMLEAAADLAHPWQTARVGATSQVAAPPPDSGARDCPERWAHYCDHLRRAIEFALARDKRVVVVTMPYISSLHIEQQRVMTRMLADRFGNHPRLAHVDLGHAVDLNDPSLSWDGMHLTASGNERIAGYLCEPILGILRNTSTRRRTTS